MKAQTIALKATKHVIDRQNKQEFTNRPRPDIRDDLDSRSQKEAGFRGEKSKKGDRAPAKKRGR